jgi:hypothetical protein
MTGVLQHVGYVYDSTAGFADGVLSQVRAVLGDGGLVSAVVDPWESEVLRSAIGPSPSLTFTPPAEAARSGADFSDHLRDVAADRGGLVLAQYSAFGIPDGELRRGEDDINEFLAHLPLTVICACATTAASTRLATARDAHPRLLVDGVIRDNDGFHRTDVPPEPGVGTPILGLTFRGAADLQHVRGHVRSVSSSVGLDEEVVDAHVVAVHEAALVVANHQPDRPGAPGPYELDMWATDSAITVEVRGPRWSAVQTGPPSGVLEYVRLFCSHAAGFETGENYGVRLFTRRWSRV